LANYVHSWPWWPSKKAPKQQNVLDEPAGTFEEDKARAYAYLSAAPYCNDVQSILDWTCKPCKRGAVNLIPGKIRVIDADSYNETRVIVGRVSNDTGCVMAFRGTKYMANWERNVEFWKVQPEAYSLCDGCKVHSGFSKTWLSVRNLTMAALKDVGCEPGGENKALYITGHSMGASLTHLAMFDLQDDGYDIKNSYSFEAPRVGNMAFSKAFSNRFPSRDVPVFRVTHYMDPVVHLPPTWIGYVHVETEVWFDDKGKWRVCDGRENQTCGADQFSNTPNMMVNHGADHCGNPLVEPTTAHPEGNICFYCNYGGAIEEVKKNHEEEEFVWSI